MAKVALDKNKGLFHWQTGPKKRHKLIKCCIRGPVLDVADTWTLRKPATPFNFRNAVLEKDGKIICTDKVKKEEVFQTVKVEWNIPHTTELRKVNWIGHI
jgi:hypothetical protein